MLKPDDDKVWDKMLKLHQNGCLLGAGSPSNPAGDSAISETGIVQGHAYSILDVRFVNGNKLIKLRNPHGSVGIEYNGDWSDDSELWST